MLASKHVEELCILHVLQKPFSPAPMENLCSDKVILYSGKKCFGVRLKGALISP